MGPTPEHREGVGAQWIDTAGCFASPKCDVRSFVAATEAGESARQGAGMRRFWWLRVAVVLGLAGALADVVADRVAAAPARGRGAAAALGGNKRRATGAGG